MGNSSELLICSTKSNLTNRSFLRQQSITGAEGTPVATETRKTSGCDPLLTNSNRDRGCGVTTAFE